MLKYYFILFFLLLQIGMRGANSFFENRHILFSASNVGGYKVIQPGETITSVAKFNNVEYPTRKFLRVVGKVDMPGVFFERGETKFRMSEFYIDDNLDSLVTYNDKYSLFFKGNNDNFERHVLT